MADHDNDIDALRNYLYSNCRAEYFETFKVLLAERNALRQRVAGLEAQSAKSYWRERVAELEAQPVDRDLRERLVCAALTGLCADPNLSNMDIGRAVSIADAALAAMRKEGGGA